MNNEKREIIKQICTYTCDYFNGKIMFKGDVLSQTFEIIIGSLTCLTFAILQESLKEGEKIKKEDIDDLFPIIFLGIKKSFYDNLTN